MSTNGDKSNNVEVKGITAQLATEKDIEITTQDKGEIESPLAGLVIEVGTFTATKSKDGKIERIDNKTGERLSGKPQEIERD